MNKKIILGASALLFTGIVFADGNPGTLTLNNQSNARVTINCNFQNQSSTSSNSGTMGNNMNNMNNNNMGNNNMGNQSLSGTADGKKITVIDFTKGLTTGSNANGSNATSTNHVICQLTQGSSNVGSFEYDIDSNNNIKPTNATSNSCVTSNLTQGQQVNSVTLTVNSTSNCS